MPPHKLGQIIGEQSKENEFLLKMIGIPCRERVSEGGLLVLPNRPFPPPSSLSGESSSPAVNPGTWSDESLG